MDMATFASPTYLDRYGIPSHPDDLAQHHVIRFVFPNGQLQKLKFGRDGLSVLLSERLLQGKRSATANELEPASSVIRDPRSRRCDSLAERLRQRDIGRIAVWFIAHRDTTMNQALDFTMKKAMGEL